MLLSESLDLRVGIQQDRPVEGERDMERIRLKRLERSEASGAEQLQTSRLLGLCRNLLIANELNGLEQRVHPP